ncbi:hypothetical protein OESDEN_18870 [Oesophagostomum dentatum]|uniref:Uncharacterized protein n=1 Tax=Oesophagostomum dentatum TaxID=61180 RepID=A0A0B1S930_OESDE|nr:hypothetical protein OESDEN_18870 [Oesophagostomum dentatum]
MRVKPTILTSQEELYQCLNSFSMKVLNIRMERQLRNHNKRRTSLRLCIGAQSRTTIPERDGD